MSDEIIAWRLKVSRVHELGIIPPDPSRLISEWLTTTDGLLEKLNNSALTFRIQSLRMHLAIDTHPSNEALQAFLTSLQAELGQMALAEPSTVLQINQVNAKGSGKNQQQQQGQKGQQSGKGGQQSGQSGKGGHSTTQRKVAWQVERVSLAIQSQRRCSV